MSLIKSLKFFLSSWVGVGVGAPNYYVLKSSLTKNLKFFILGYHFGLANFYFETFSHYKCAIHHKHSPRETNNIRIRLHGFQCSKYMKKCLMTYRRQPCACFPHRFVHVLSGKLKARLQLLQHLLQCQIQGILEHFSFFNNNADIFSIQRPR